MKKFLIVYSLLLIVIPSFSQISQNVNLLYQWHDTTITINFRDARYSDVWGFVQNAREYAVIGSTFGTHVFDVTNPSNTYQADSVAGAFQGFNVNHRDYKDYIGYLYAVCDEGSSTLQIFDLSYLPDSISKVYDDDSLFIRAHTIFIDSVSARLYTCGTNSNALSIYSILNPSSPQLLSHYNDVPYVHDIYVRNDTAYLNCGDSGLYIIDFQTPSVPVTFGSLTVYPDQGYNHSGWLNSTGDIYVFCDETYGRELKVCDVSDFGNIQILSTLTSGVSDSSVAHNAFIKDNFIYIAYYNDGLQIFDISNPFAPIKKGYYDTFAPSQKDDFRGAWGVYPFLPSGIVLLSDRNTGLYVFDVSQALVSVPELNIDNDNISIHPNPFTSMVNINFSIETDQNVSILLHDIQGREVNTLLSSHHNAGQYNYQFDFSDKKFESEIYILQVIMDNQVVTKRIVKLNFR